MPQSVPTTLREHDDRLDRLEERAEKVASLAWSEVDPEAISESWERMIPLVAAEVTRSQSGAVASGVQASRHVAVDTGQYELPDGFVDASPLVGVGSTGAPLDTVLYSPAIGVKSLLGGGMSAREAMTYGATTVASLSRTLVADAGRQGMHLDMTSRNVTGYVRVVEPGACKRCVILAGKFFRWNDGFLRHPRCRCEHMPAKSEQWAKDEGWYSDPYDYFNDLSPAEQDRVWGRSNARAIRDGADIWQVTNATTVRKAGKPPLSWDGMTTTEGTSRHGAFAKLGGGNARLTPDAIYRTAGTPTRAKRMLEQNGYILPGGQDPAGTMRNLREPAKAASKATRESWLTGTRLPRNMGTMTEAEKRSYRADRDWQMVRAGMNPYQAGAAQRWRYVVYGEGTPRGGSLSRDLTDADREKAEAAYRKYVLGLDGGDPAKPKRN